VPPFRVVDDPRAGNEARYDRMAPHYARLLGLGSLGLVRRPHRAVADELARAAPGTLVEVGCGPATLTPYLRAALGEGTRILGVDLSGRMIALARLEAPRVRPLLGGSYLLVSGGRRA
jgi:ubiquinone/menaquinone biosynthesis C-methylase UbiE